MSIGGLNLHFVEFPVDQSHSNAASPLNQCNLHNKSITTKECSTTCTLPMLYNNYVQYNFSLKMVRAKNRAISWKIYYITNVHYHNNSMATIN